MHINKRNFMGTKPDRTTDMHHSAGHPNNSVAQTQVTEKVQLKVKGTDKKDHIEAKIELEKFHGYPRQDVVGWFRKFERACTICGIGENQKLHYLDILVADKALDVLTEAACLTYYDGRELLITTFTSTAKERSLLHQLRVFRLQAGESVDDCGARLHTLTANINTIAPDTR